MRETAARTRERQERERKRCWTWAGVKMRGHEGVGERGRVRRQSNVQERVGEFEGWCWRDERDRVSVKITRASQGRGLKGTGKGLRKKAQKGGEGSSVVDSVQNAGKFLKPSL